MHIPRMFVVCYETLAKQANGSPKHYGGMRIEAITHDDMVKQLNAAIKEPCKILEVSVVQ